VALSHREALLNLGYFTKQRFDLPTVAVGTPDYQKFVRQGRRTNWSDTDGAVRLRSASSAESGFGIICLCDTKRNAALGAVHREFFRSTMNEPSNQSLAANAGWRSHFRIRGQRHRPGVAELGSLGVTAP